MTIDRALAIGILLILPFAWTSTAVLFYAAHRPPRIGALTERAIIALVIAVFLTAIAILVWNTELDRTLFPTEVARVVFRITVLALGLVPVIWVLLWATRRLGDGE